MYHVILDPPTGILRIHLLSCLSGVLFSLSKCWPDKTAEFREPETKTKDKYRLVRDNCLAMKRSPASFLNSLCFAISSWKGFNLQDKMVKPLARRKTFLPGFGSIPSQRHCRNRWRSQQMQKRRQSCFTWDLQRNGLVFSAGLGFEDLWTCL